MEITEIDSKKFSQLFDKQSITYNSVRFNLSNQHKCQDLKFLLFQERKSKIGLIAGINNGNMYQPFSAPFSCFSFQNGELNSETILKTFEKLDEYCEEQKIRSLKFTLPPFFYNEHIISKLIYCFFRSNYSSIVDLNHFFYTHDFSMYENNTMKKGLRYNLRVAFREGLRFKIATGIGEYKIAYKILKENRECQARDLNMSLEQVLDMKELIDVDFFLVYIRDKPIAAAFVYEHTPEIAQVICWGDLLEYRCYYCMNFLAMNVFQFYKDRGFEIVDLGNTSENSEPNFGLEHFKEIIGATSTLKYTFTKNIVTHQFE